MMSPSCRTTSCARFAELEILAVDHDSSVFGVGPRLRARDAGANRVHHDDFVAGVGGRRARERERLEERHAGPLHRNLARGTHLADDVHELALVLVDFDPHLRIPDIAGGQHGRQPLLELGGGQAQRRRHDRRTGTRWNRRRRRGTCWYRSGSLNTVTFTSSCSPIL